MIRIEDGVKVTKAAHLLVVPARKGPFHVNGYRVSYEGAEVGFVWNTGEYQAGSLCWSHSLRPGILNNAGMAEAVKELLDQSPLTPCRACRRGEHEDCWVVGRDQCACLIQDAHGIGKRQKEHPHGH